MGKAIIKYNNPKKEEDEEFYEKFIECLKSGDEFKIYDAVVEGNIDIKEIYERIKNIKDEELKGATLEKKDYKIIIKININVYMVKVKFKGEFKMCYSTNFEEPNIRTIFGGNAFFTNSTFEKGANFDYSIFKKDAVFWLSKFGDKGSVKFRYSIFEGEAQFNNSVVGFRIHFMNSIFKGKADFSSAIFKHAEFNHAIFEKDADFKNTISGKLEFDKSTFEDVAYFRDIYFGILSFVDCTFKGMAEFRKGRIRFKKYEWYNNRYYVKRQDKLRAKLISNTIEYSLAIFNNAQFLNKHSKIKNFQLSKTSFLMTDVREIMLLCDIKKEKILSHMLFENKLKESRDNKNKPDESKDNEKTENENKTYYHILKNRGYFYFNELIEDINYNSVLAEYRNLRISVEDNMTYEEASNLYKMEMEFKKKYSKNNFEKLAIWFYNLVSNCGESVEISVLCICLAIVLLPLGALTYNYHFSHKYECFLFFLPFIILFSNWLINQIVKDKKIKLNMNSKIKNFILLYVPVIFWSALIIYYGYYLYTKYPLLIRDTITAFFQLKIDDAMIEGTDNYKHFMKNWEPLIRVISLILLGNLYIALRRRLSRK
ncbi:pentapeptide repeat-containing protein [Methanothermococcus sp. Ax23]|uniref:pentapeptide repeat-containing protein n=1 Tax=Methanothermococcus sp. Ax23 TaxID=3156486 RepID=UPI003B9EA910